MASKKELLGRKSNTQPALPPPCSLSVLPHHLPIEPKTEEQTLHWNSSVPSPLNYLETRSFPSSPTGKELLKSLQSPTAHSSRDAAWTRLAQGGLTSSPWAGSQFHSVTAPCWGRQEQPVGTARSVPHPSTFLCSCPGPKVRAELWLGKRM